VLACSGEDISAAIELVDRALKLNPSFARLGDQRPVPVMGRATGTGDWSPRNFLEAEPARLQSRDLNRIGVAYFSARRFDVPREMLVRSPQSQSWLGTHLAPLSGMLRSWGRFDEAKDHQAAPGGSSCPGPNRKASAQPQATRAIPVGPAAGGRRSDMSHPFHTFSSDPSRGQPVWSSRARSFSKCLHGGRFWRFLSARDPRAHMGGISAGGETPRPGPGRAPRNWDPSAGPRDSAG
jgi:hypothetical protein